MELNQIYIQFVCIISLSLDQLFILNLDTSKFIISRENCVLSKMDDRIPNS